MKYLNYTPWSEWTRDERFFCSLLYHHARVDAGHFAAVVGRAAVENGCTSLSIPLSGAWDLGYEVSFYRDYLWQQGLNASDLGVSSQRTFDLCLFGERAIVIIEAKVYEPFSAGQNDFFSTDKQKLRQLTGLEDLEIFILALASSKYFVNQKKYGQEGTLAVFDGKITWDQMYREYDDPLLRKANEMYKAKPDKTRTKAPGP